MRGVYKAADERVEKDSAGFPTGRRIVNINDSVYGYRGLFIDADGSQEIVKGTWAFSDGLSWWSESRRQWLIISGKWQA